MEKAWFMAAMGKNTNGKGVMAPMEYTSWFIGPQKRHGFMKDSLLKW